MGIKERSIHKDRMMGISKPNMNDNQIWLRLKKGDENALEFIFEKYFPTLFDYGMKITPQAELVRDSIQELFIYIWTHRKNLSEVHSLRAYLLTSLRRSMLKKRQNSEKMHSIDKTNEAHLFSNLFSPEYFMILHETEEENKKFIRNALRQIPDRIREALYLKTYQGLTYQEIGEVMGITYQVARNYIWEGLKKLRTIILEEQAARR